MAARPMRVMFIGTCRMHDPSNVLKDDPRFMVRSTPHRFHTPRQTLQFVRHMQGIEPYQPEAAHLISDYASASIYERGQDRGQVLASLAGLDWFWPTCGAFVIEICALREPFAKHQGEEITVNSFSARDQEKHADAIVRDAEAGESLPLMDMGFHRVAPESAQQAMAEIKKVLGKPIIWVSHQRPPSDDPQYEVVNKVRLHLAATLKAGAEALGDQFFDPSTVAAEMGQSTFFQKEGADLDHMTPEAARIMAGHYAEMLLQRTR